MPNTYRVTDPSTGRTLRLTGDSPPTEQELEDIFAAQAPPKKSLLERATTNISPTASAAIGGLHSRLSAAADAESAKEQPVMRRSRTGALYPSSEGNVRSAVTNAAAGAADIMLPQADAAMSPIGLALSAFPFLSRAVKAATAAPRVVETAVRQMPPLAEAASTVPRSMPNLVKPTARVAGKAPTVEESIQQVLEEARRAPSPGRVSGQPPQTITDAGKVGDFYSTGNPATTAARYDEIIGRGATPPVAPPAAGPAVAAPAQPLGKAAKDIVERRVSTQGPPPGVSDRRYVELLQKYGGKAEDTYTEGTLNRFAEMMGQKGAKIDEVVESSLKAGKVEVAAKTIEDRVKLSVSELAQQMRRQYGSARAGKMLQPNQPAKVGAAQIKRLAPGPSRLPLVAEEAMREGGVLKHLPDRLLDEAGGISPKVMGSIAGAGAGAAIGGTQGETGEERLENAAIGGAAGALVVPFIAHAAAIGAPKAIQNFLYTSILSSPQSVLKAYSGAVGGTIGAAMEKMAVGDVRAGTAIINELFNPKSIGKFVSALKNPQTASLTGMAQDAPTVVGRIFGAGDSVARSAMAAGGIGAEEAARYTLSGIPTTEIGQYILGGWSKWFTLRLMTTMFPRVGIQILERGLERTPAGLMGLKGLNEGASTGTKLARAAGGTAAGLGAYQGADQAPDWAKPYLVALSGVYGLPVGLGVAGAEAAKRGKGVMGQAKAGVAEFSRNLPFPQFGPAQVLDPENLASMAVPNLLRDVARARDPHERDTAGQTLGRAKAKIPGLRETLPVKGRNVNIAGQPNENRLSPATRFLTPAAKEPLPMKDVPEPVVRELERLEININAPSFDRTIKLGTRTFDIPPEAAERARTERRQYLLPQIQQMLASPAYRRADDTRKKRMLEAVISRAETAGAQRARARLVQTLRQGQR